MIKIINLLPELLGTYGDQGNVATLSWRLTQRGIENQVIQASARNPIPTDGDFYFLGGGEDFLHLGEVFHVVGAEIGRASCRERV